MAININWRLVAVDDDSITIRWNYNTRQDFISYPYPLDPEGELLDAAAFNLWIEEKAAELVNEFRQKKQKFNQVKGWGGRKGTVEVV